MLIYIVTSFTGTLELIVLELVFRAKNVKNKKRPSFIKTEPKNEFFTWLSKQQNLYLILMTYLVWLCTSY